MHNHNEEAQTLAPRSRHQRNAKDAVYAARIAASRLQTTHCNRGNRIEPPVDKTNGSVEEGACNNSNDAVTPIGRSVSCTAVGSAEMDGRCGSIIDSHLETERTSRKRQHSRSRGRRSRTNPSNSYYQRKKPKSG